MKSKIHPYHPLSQYKGNVVPSSYEDTSNNNDTIKQSDNNLISSSSKLKIPLWPTVLWISLGTLIFICLVILVIVPVAALANIGNATTISTICPTTAITTTVASSQLAEQCVNYTTLTDYTRSPDYLGTSPCDLSLFNVTPMWVRFTGSGGSLLASCPIDEYRCGADAPGWYSGIYPSVANTITSGFVCFNFYNDSCVATSLILVSNCNGFYVYYLRATPGCNLRYCTI